jgi:hypothetical protein
MRKGEKGMNLLNLKNDFWLLLFTLLQSKARGGNITINQSPPKSDDDEIYICRDGKTLVVLTLRHQGVACYIEEEELFEFGRMHNLLQVINPFFS